MGKIKNSKKMRITSIFKAMEITQQHVQPWHWPPCILQPRTLSFRAAGGQPWVESPDSCFSNASMSTSFSTESEDAFHPSCDDSVEVLVREMALSEDRRLFFEPDENKTSSILSNEARTRPEEGQWRAMALAVESEDPYHDFRRSMEEMVVSHGLEDWDCLEELLSWYLRVNGDANHGLIIDAFIDLLIGLSPH